MGGTQAALNWEPLPAPDDWMGGLGAAGRMDGTRRRHREQRGPTQRAPGFDRDRRVLQQKVYFSRNIQNVLIRKFNGAGA